MGREVWAASRKCDRCPVFGPVQAKPGLPDAAPGMHTCGRRQLDWAQLLQASEPHEGSPSAFQESSCLSQAQPASAPSDLVCERKGWMQACRSLSSSTCPTQHHASGAAPAARSTTATARLGMLVCLAKRLSRAQRGWRCRHGRGWLGAPENRLELAKLPPWRVQVSKASPWPGSGTRHAFGYRVYLG